MFCLSRIWITNCTCAVKIDLVWPKHLGRIDTRSWRCYAVLHELHVTKLNIKPMVGTCRKRTISAPELETSRRERWEQNLAKEIRKQQKIFYQPHIYVKNVGPCNFWCLFPCSPTYLMFPCSLRSFCFVPVFPCSPKTPGGPSAFCTCPIMLEFGFDLLFVIDLRIRASYIWIIYCSWAVNVDSETPLTGR